MRRKVIYGGGQFYSNIAISEHTYAKKNTNVKLLVIFDGIDEGAVCFFARAERITLYRCSFIDAVADAGTESDGLLLGGKCFGFWEIEFVILGEIGFEAVEVVVGD